MSEIGTYTSNFFNELVNYGYEIPLQFKIYALIIFIVILIELYFITVKNVPLDSKYIKWGFAFILLNIINIIITFQLYKKFSGKFIGLPGEKGPQGDKGNIGENITCKICDFNIYLQKTNRYDLKMTFSTNIFKLLYNQSYNYLDIYNMFNDNIDTDGLLKSLYDNRLSTELSQLPNLINKQKYVLMYDLLREVLPSYEKLTVKTPGRKRGYTPVSDVIVPEKYDNNSYVFNSDDMRYPTSYSKITSIYANEDGKKVKYDIMSLNGPTEQKPNTDESIKDGKATEVITNNYRGLGVVLFNSEQRKELNLYVCLNDKCLKKAEVQDYRIKCIYPNNETGFVSFWLSDFNTMQVVNSQESDLVDNKRVIEIIKSFDEDIYYDSGAVKKEVINQTTKFLNNIKISKLSVFCYIISSYLSIINTDFTDFKNDYVNKLNINLGIHSNSNINYTNVNDVLDKVDDELKRVEDEYNTALSALNDVPVDNIISGSNDKASLIFNAKKLATLMRKTLDFIPAYIDNTTTLMGLVERIFDDGLYTRIKLDNITPQQKSLIYLMKVLMPPLIDVYIPKNSCLVYEQIDEERINLLNTCENLINKYNELIEDINNDTDGKYSTNLRKEINRLNDIIAYKFDSDFNNINEYMNKLGSFNFKEFTKSQLKIIIEEYNKVLLAVNNN